MENRKLVIKTNNTVCKEVCPICGDWHKDAGWPYWIFAEGSYAGICESCSEKNQALLSEVEQKNQAAIAEFEEERRRNGIVDPLTKRRFDG